MLVKASFGISERWDHMLLKFYFICKVRAYHHEESVALVRCCLMLWLLSVYPNAALRQQFPFYRRNIWNTNTFFTLCFWFVHWHQYTMGLRCYFPKVIAKPDVYALLFQLTLNVTLRSRQLSCSWVISQKDACITICMHSSAFLSRAL